MLKLDKAILNDLKNIEKDYLRAKKLVEILFEDKKDKEGQPYIGHLIRVSNKLSNENTRIAGLLHDVVEDIPDFTFEDLRNLNFNEEIITLVKIVTKNKTKKEKYHDKITSIIKTNNIEAIKLKYSDMLDNFDTNRLNKLDIMTRSYLFNKYKDEIVRLENILKEKGEKL